MKKIMIFINLMCVFVLSLTQTKAETLKSFLPEKTGIENHTVQDFVDYWSNKSDEELLYYVGAQFVWSAKNTRVSSTESVYDKMKQSGYDYAFGEPAMIREWMSYLERGFEPLTGQVRTAGISSQKAIDPLTRNAYANELPFVIDWNFVEEMSDPSAPLNFGADIDPVQIFSAKCGNPLYPARVGGGYRAPKPNNHQYSERSPGDNYEQAKTAPTEGGNTYVTNNYYGDDEEVSFEESNDGYVDQRAQWYFQVGLNFNVGPQYANTCCGGYGGYQGSGYGYAGQSPGYCPHNQPYQQFAYQPSGGGNPQNINIEVINQITNTATATATNNNTNTSTNTTTVNNNGHGHGNPNPNPGPGPGPIDPPTGGGDGHPIDPPTGRHSARMTPKGNSYQNNLAVGQTRPDSRPTTSQGSNPKAEQFQTTTSRPVTMTPKGNHGNEALAQSHQTSSRPDSRPKTETSVTPRQESRPQTSPSKNQYDSRQSYGNNSNQTRANAKPQQSQQSRQSYGSSGQRSQTAYNQPQSRGNGNGGNVQRGASPTGGGQSRSSRR